MIDVQQLKESLATCCRILLMEGLVDYNGHVSARIPGTDRVLIHGRQVSRRVVTAKDFVTVDLDGNKLEGETEPPGETAIHTCIYRARPDVFSVAHLHPHFSTLLGIARQPIVPVFTLGAPFGDGVPLYDDPDLVVTREQGDALAAALGNKRAVLLRGHGCVVVGENVTSTLVGSVFFEENARKQYQASLVGDVKVFSGDEVERAPKSIWRDGTIRKVWAYLESKARAEGYL